MDTASWQGPPPDVLGRPVPIQRFVARTRGAVIALQHAVAFPQGCILALSVAVRRDSLDDPVWDSVVDSHRGAGLGSTVADGGLRFGVRFPDGGTATTVEHPFRAGAPSSDRPHRPMLVEAGSESSGDDRHYHGHQRLWLSPLPPPASFEFVAEWRNLGLARTAIAIDGTAIGQAATYALPFWD
ncbi:hypothetical protein [Couchioplanes azureus]|uniref:hypothetical protein n=1 Tax=Couchioplanes caeruleus TaxID=56438 RepID=UPI001997D99E|nr:hypothetical protein [Couchioplanes caeruleus]GGQ75892.1 hypothetical protein GCM10010166_52550 [Couchioplanes caeruleus subsp. azureus]